MEYHDWTGRLLIAVALLYTLAVIAENAMKLSAP